MADPIISPILIGIGVITSLAGMSQQKKAQRSQDKAQAAADTAQQAQWQTELETHQFNIDIAKKGLREGTADISREGARFQRLQGAAMGASGATLGFGTPLMNMITTAAGIERDKSRLAAQTQAEIDFRQGEIDALNLLLNPVEEEVLEEPEKENKKPTSTGGRDRTGSANLGRA